MFVDTPWARLTLTSIDGENSIGRISIFRVKQALAANPRRKLPSGYPDE
jgi:hypothetical protein